MSLLLRYYLVYFVGITLSYLKLFYYLKKAITYK